MQQTMCSPANNLKSGIAYNIGMECIVKNTTTIDSQEQCKSVNRTIDSVDIAPAARSFIVEVMTGPMSHGGQAGPIVA